MTSASCAAARFATRSRRKEAEVPDQHALRPDRFYVIGDAGSFYEDETCADGFETPEAAAEWSRTQTLWQYGAELDFSDGMTSMIVSGSDLIANEAAWDQWHGEGDWPKVPPVHNWAIDLGLVTEPEP
jgi:hypothetical protein